MGRRTVLGISLVLGLAGPWTIASDPPHSLLNAQSGDIEVTDAYWTGSDYDIRHVVNRQGSHAAVYAVSTNPLDDLGPRIAIGGGGDTHVVWWRDAAPATVLVRTRDHATGTWDQERVVSDPAEESLNPDVVYHGTDLWVAFEAKVGSLTDIKVCRVIDAPDPISPVGIASIPYAGDVDVSIQAESGSLWVTWIEDADRVGFSEYDSSAGTWSLADYEPRLGDTVDDTRARVRAAVIAE